MLFVRQIPYSKIVYSLSMKFKFWFILVCLSWGLYGCPPTKYKTDLDKIKDNNMDLPDCREQYYEGLRFKLSDLFHNDYNTEYVMQDNALTMALYDIDVNFSIEYFTKSEAELIQFTFEDEIDALNAVHDNYVFKRLETLNEGESSIKKNNLKCKYPCVSQVIHGGSYFYGEPSTYLIATVEANDKYYVIHLIGIEKNMGYLYDDFEAIIESLTI